MNIPSKTSPRHIAQVIAAIAVGAMALPAWAQITFYEHEGFLGRAVSSNRAVQDFRSIGFNDRASSAVVEGGRWEVCDNTQFGGSCVVLRPGNYSSLSGMGLNDRVSSSRPADRRRAQIPDAPQPVAGPPYEYRRRPQERLFEARVTSARAVVGAPTERCWIEREEANRHEGPAVGRAVLGAVLGGVIGHQIGGGTGRDLATAGGAVAGGVIGANAGRGHDGNGRDVRRCESVPSTVPAYWDVTYDFRGVHHRLQMNSEPGATISVNQAGEPRQ